MAFTISCNTITATGNYKRLNVGALERLNTMLPINFPLSDLLFILWEILRKIFLLHRIRCSAIFSDGSLTLSQSSFLLFALQNDKITILTPTDTLESYQF